MIPVSFFTRVVLLFFHFIHSHAFAKEAKQAQLQLQQTDLIQNSYMFMITIRGTATSQFSISIVSIQCFHTVTNSDAEP